MTPNTKDTEEERDRERQRGKEAKTDRGREGFWKQFYILFIFY